MNDIQRLSHFMGRQKQFQEDKLSGQMSLKEYEIPLRIARIPKYNIKNPLKGRP